VGVRRTAKTRIRRRDRLAAHGGAWLPLLRLIDEHDGDTVADRVPSPARVADDHLVLDVDRGRAGRTSQDVQELLVDHRPSGAGYGIVPFA
jgi:hypothetical protein